MAGSDIVMFCWPDLVGLNRGRSFPLSELPGRLKHGIILPPAVQALLPFPLIADPTPWGPMNDVILIPDVDSEIKVDVGEDASPLHLFMCDWYNLDGTPWTACGRSFLKRALDDLESETGLRVKSGVESEFHLSDVQPWPAPGFTVEALRLEEKFASRVTAALQQAGTEPETFEPEYGVGQYEVATSPAIGVAAADRVAITREVVREVARRMERRASFTPIINLDSVGNGVHTHISLVDAQGQPACFDAGKPGGVSELFGSFLAGIIRHLPALCVFTVPSPASFLRLTPGRWSSSVAAVGTGNREAALRLPPIWSGEGATPAKRLNVEYRVGDATASPHLTLGVLVRAGLKGIQEKLPAPELLNIPPSELGEAERKKRGIELLPASLDEALALADADSVVKGWFPDDLWSVFRSVKQGEIACVKDMSPEEIAEIYRKYY